MYLKLKNLIEDVTGFSFYRNNTPWGLNLYKDINRLIPKWSPQVIFDVGANIGQTAVAFHKAWPNAKIFSFEPVQNTFSILQKSIQNLPNVEAVPLALGSVSGEANIKIFSDSRLASLDNRFSSESNSHGYETIKISTVDIFCTQRSIDKINILKIDTEGHDLEVLKGSIALLEAGQIDLVFAEISMRHIPGKVFFSDIDSFLTNYGFSCFGIHHQDFIPYNHLHYGNALFLKEKLIF